MHKNVKYKNETKFNPGLTLFGLSGTGPRGNRRKLIWSWTNPILSTLTFCYWHHRYPKLQILASRFGAHWAVASPSKKRKRKSVNCYWDLKKKAYFALAMCFLIVTVWPPADLISFNRSSLGSDCSLYRKKWENQRDKNGYMVGKREERKMI